MLSQVMLIDLLYPAMKHFYPDRSGLSYQDDSASHPRITEWDYEYENDVNHMLWPSQSLDLNLFEVLREILDPRVSQCSPPTSSKHQFKEYLLEIRCSILPIQFQRPVVSTVMWIKAVVVAGVDQAPSSSVALAATQNQRIIYPRYA